MSEPENFLVRWSRRKVESEREAHGPSDREAGDAGAEQPAAKPLVSDGVSQGDRPDAGGDGSAQPFDLSSLPSLESITAQTDIRLFLQKGVPAELTRAALRRAWSADPVIRDFVGIAENQWDFATGKDLPGFGSLDIGSEELRRMVASVFGEGPPADGKPDAKPATLGAKGPSEADNPVSVPVGTTMQDERPAGEVRQVEYTESELNGAPPEDVVRRNKEDFAMQQNADDRDQQLSSVRRAHGRALPQ